MNGDLGRVDIMSGEEEVTDGNSFSLFKKKRKKKGGIERRCMGYKRNNNMYAYQ